MISDSTQVNLDPVVNTPPGTEETINESKLLQLVTAANEATADDIAQREIELMVETLRPVWIKADTDLKPLFGQYRTQLIELRQLQDWQDDADARYTEEVQAHQSELKESFFELRKTLLDSLWVTREARELVATYESGKNKRRLCAASAWAHLVDGCAERWQEAADAVQWLAAKSGGERVLNSAAYSPGRADMRDWLAELMCYYGFSCERASIRAEYASIKHPLLPGSVEKSAPGFAYLMGNPSWEDAEMEVREDLTRHGVSLDEVPRYPFPPQAEPSAIETQEEAEASGRLICRELDDKLGDEVLQGVEDLMAFLEAQDNDEK